MPVESRWIATRPAPFPSTNCLRTRCPGLFGATMPTSTSRSGSIWPKWTLNPWANMSRLPGAIPSRISASQTSACFVRQQDHHDVALAGGVRDRQHAQSVPLRLLDGRRVLAQTDYDVDARILEAERMGVALRAVADDGHGLAVELGEIVLVVDHGRETLVRSTAEPVSKQLSGGAARRALGRRIDLGTL